MKKCPECKTTYADPAQVFCLNDGAVLIEDLPYGPDSQATVIQQPPVRRSDVQRTEKLVQPAPTASWNNNSPQYVSPLQPKPSRLPWVLGGVAALLIGLTVFAVGAFIIVRGLSSDSGGDSPNVNSRIVTTNTNQRGTNSRDSNSNNSNAGSNKNDNGSSGGTDSAPKDTQVVFNQLVDLEHKWMTANIAGDKDALNRILADDYSSPESDGSTKTKKDYLATATPITNVVSWKLENLSSSNDGNTAVIYGIVDWVSTSEKYKFRFRDDYVWRDGRWQATKSITSRIN